MLKRNAVLLALLFTVICVIPGFGATQKDQAGPAPSGKPAVSPSTAALTSNLVVEVHQSHTGTNLWYLVGKLNRSTGTIDWGPSHKFDQGRIPSIGF